MDQLGLEQVFFLPNSVSCCPLGAALRDPTMCCGKVLISHRPQGRHAPNIHPCFWGGLKLLLPVRIRVPIEGHHTRQEHRCTVARLVCLHPVVATQEFRLSVSRLCSQEVQLQVFASSFPGLHKPNDMPAADQSPAVTS